MKEGIDRGTKNMESSKDKGEDGVIKVKEGESKTNDKDVKTKTKDAKTAEAPKKKGKEFKPPTKVVVRRLPPSMTEEEFLQQIDPLPPVDFMYYVQADNSLYPNNFCRAYLNFVNQADIFIFTQKFDNYVFVDSKGVEYPAVVEFAPFQRIPKQRQTKKKDTKSGTLESDPFYVSFLEKLEAEAQEASSANNNAKQHFFETNVDTNEVPKVSSTPLLDFLHNKYQERRRVREEKRKKDLERKKAKDEIKKAAKKEEESPPAVKAHRNLSLERSGDENVKKSPITLLRKPVGLKGLSEDGIPLKSRKNIVSSSDKLQEKSKHSSDELEVNSNLNFKKGSADHSSILLKKSIKKVADSDTVTNSIYGNNNCEKPSTLEKTVSNFVGFKDSQNKEVEKEMLGPRTIGEEYMNRTLSENYKHSRREVADYSNNFNTGCVNRSSKSTNCANLRRKFASEDIFIDVKDCRFPDTGKRLNRNCKIYDDRYSLINQRYSSWNPDTAFDVIHKKTFTNQNYHIENALDRCQPLKPNVKVLSNVRILMPANAQYCRFFKSGKKTIETFTSKRHSYLHSYFIK